MNGEMNRRYNSPQLAIVSFIGDADGLPPDWLGQDVIALNLLEAVALVAPRNDTAHWCAQRGWKYCEIAPLNAPFEFIRGVRVEWRQEAGEFWVLASHDAVGPTAPEAPNFGFGATKEQHDFWGLSEYTPEGITFSYRLAEDIGAGIWAPMLARYVQFADVRDAAGTLRIQALDQTRIFVRELVANIDAEANSLIGFVHL